MGFAMDTQHQAFKFQPCGKGKRKKKRRKKDIKWTVYQVLIGSSPKK